MYIIIVLKKKKKIVHCKEQLVLEKKCDTRFCPDVLNFNDSAIMRFYGLFPLVLFLQFKKFKLEKEATGFWYDSEEILTTSFNLSISSYFKYENLCRRGVQSETLSSFWWNHQSCHVEAKAELSVSHTDGLPCLSRIHTVVPFQIKERQLGGEYWVSLGSVWQGPTANSWESTWARSTDLHNNDRHSSNCVHIKVTA